MLRYSSRTLAIALGRSSGDIRPDTTPTARRGVGHIDGLAALIVRADLDRGVHAAGGGAADQQRQVEALALHLGGDMAHLVERRRDQARQADDVDLHLARRVEDLLRRHHDAEIGHLVIVALKHDADDVLADVVHVALDGGEQDLAGGLALGEAKLLLLLLHEGHEIGHGLLHHPRRLHHLRQEHLAGAEQIADHVHALHQRAFDDVQRTLGLERAPPRYPRRYRCRCRGPARGSAAPRPASRARRDRPRASAPRRPCSARPLRAGGRWRRARRLRITSSTRVAQLGIDVVVERELAGIDDAHIHAGLDGVIEEHRVHRLAHAVVAAEGEGEVRHAARHMHVRQLGLDAARRVDIGAGIVVMLLDAGGDGKDVGIEDDVFGREADFLGQELVGALADLEFARRRVSAWPFSSKAITTTAAP